MKVDLLEIGQIDEKDLRYAVISASFRGSWIFVKHKERTTWEIPGGRRESGEAIYNTAKRELQEETGAKLFKIEPVCDYSVTKEAAISFGRLFYAEVEMLGKLPALEIGEAALFEELPENLTYPEIQPLLHTQILKWRE